MRRPLMRISVLFDAVAPNPRMSTVVPAPFTPPNRLVIWTPGSRARMSWTVTLGERSMSAAVITVVEAPVMVELVTMPDGFSTTTAPGVAGSLGPCRGRHAGRRLRIALARRPARHRRAQAARGRVDVDGFERHGRRGRRWLRVLCLSRGKSQHGGASQQRRAQVSQTNKCRSHDPRPSLRCPQPRAPGDRARREGRVNGWLSNPPAERMSAAGDGRTPPTLKSWKESTAFASVMCHRCEQPLRVVLPAHRLGDCAGRSPGSRVNACRPAFPVSQWPIRTNARRLQLRGQPRFHLQRADDPCSLLPPRCKPRNQHALRFP